MVRVNILNFLGKKKAQISIEYIIIIGFVTIILIGIISIAFFYSGGIKDRIRLNQVNNFANKITSTAESVFFSGKPSRATINTYLPNGVESIEIIENSIVISIKLNSGSTKTAFSSNVPINGSITTTPGIKRVELNAEQNNVVISLA